MTATTDKPIRGKVLGTYLICLVLLNLVLMVTDTALMVGYIRDHDPQFTGTEQWVLPLLILTEIATIGALIALWFWRKAGYRVLIVAGILETVFMLLLNIQFLTAIVPVTTLAILWTLLQKRWQYFH